MQIIVSDYYYLVTCISAASDIMRIELKLREEIQKDYLQKLKEIENKYEKSCTFNKELYKEQSEKFRMQEMKYRDQLGIVLAECAQKIKTLESDRQEVLKKYNVVQENFENFKQHVNASEEAYKRIIKESQVNLQVSEKYMMSICIFNIIILETNTSVEELVQKIR